MSALSLEWLGYMAATLTTGSFALQAWHTFRTRDVSGISLGMYSAFTVGVALWLLAAIGTIVLLFVGGANDWYARRSAAPAQTYQPYQQL
mgnify:CR=1 FL=1